MCNGDGKLFLILSLFIIIGSSAVHTENYVTYEFSGGRLGDNIISLARALYLSYSTGMQLLYKPFPYSNQFYLHTVIKRFENVRSKSSYQIRSISHFFKKNKKFKNTIFSVPYYSEFPSEKDRYRPEQLKINWRDAGFVALLRKMLTPLKMLDLVHIPANCISVAMHMRRAEPNERGQFQDIEAWRYGSDKFMQDNFYVSALLEIRKKFPQDHLFVYIFTDTENRENLISYFQAAFCEDRNIEFHARPKDIALGDLVLDDFYSMMRFDCIVRSNSNYSYLAARLKSFLVEIAP